MPILGTINIDFHVFTLYDPKVLLISDNSTWLHIESKPAIIEVTVPGATKPVTFNFLKNGINNLNSNNLRLTCLQGDCGEEAYVNLPDGIYTITVKGSPDDYYKTKYHLKTDTITQRLDKVLIDLGFEFSTTKIKDRESILNIKFLLLIAEAYIRKADVNSSKVYFDRAVQELANLENYLR